MQGNVAPHQTQIEMPVNWSPQTAQMKVFSDQAKGSAYEKDVMMAE